MNTASFDFKGKEDSKLGYQVSAGFIMLENGKVLVSTSKGQGNYILDCFDLTGCSRDCAALALEKMMDFHKLERDFNLENDITTVLMIMTKAHERKTLSEGVLKACEQKECCKAAEFETTDLD